MDCSFTGHPVPTDKLFVLYYPPSGSHEKWDRSFFAAARAREALSATVRDLQQFFVRHVVTTRVLPGVVTLVAGLGVIAVWIAAGLAGWSEMGFLSRYLPPTAGLVMLGFGKSRVRAFLQRWKLWRNGCREQVKRELKEITAVIGTLPGDPDAEEAAMVMRRECPDALSEVAFHGHNFKAFTYMDYILSPKLRHPEDRAELPQMHSPYRDAYYVGEVVFENWRMFQQDRRTIVDPRFAGSGGRRGVI